MIILIFLLLALYPLAAESSEDRLLLDAREAIDAELYEKALSLLGEGLELYPEDIRFSMELGDLYEDRELYSLAMEAYRIGESFDPDNKDLRKKIATALSFLDRNYEAMEYLEGLVDEGVEDLLDDLGWMYYKTHQPEKGMVRIEKALEEEFDRNLSLTLGTLYSDVNDAPSCRQHYLAAIQDALKDKDDYFASVGYYNLSLAEKSFYNYPASEEYARLSLDLMERSSGHLALGDLHLMRLDFQNAEREFRAAVELDKTPLSSTNLIVLFLAKGALNNALGELDRIIAQKDESWMYYYGLNREQFTLDLYSYYADAYKGLLHENRLFKTWSVKEGFQRLKNIIIFKVKSLYYTFRFRTMALREGRLQLDGGSALRGNLTLAEAAGGYASLSGKYYRRALDLEGFEEARPWYDFLLGREEKDPVLLERALASLDPLWEKQGREESARALIPLLPRKSDYTNSLLYDIYKNNPGSLIQYGFRLPVELEISGAGRPFSRRMRRVLKGSGFRIVENSSLVLRIRGGENLNYSLSDREGRVFTSGLDPLEDQSFRTLSLWGKAFRRRVFQP